MANVLFKQLTATQFATLAQKVNTTFYRVVNPDSSEDLYIGDKKLNNGQDLLDSLYANVIEYKAAQDDDPAVSVKDALDDLFDAVGSEGSVADLISAAVATITGDASTDTVDSLTLNGLKKRVDAAQADADALETLVGTIPSTATATDVIGYVDEKAAAATYDDTALAARVTANEGAITTLNGTGAGSVAKTVDDAIAAVVASAPEDFDTLKEMSDWIAGHEDDAATMNSAISANTTAIGVASQEESAPGAGDAVVATGLHKKIEDETARATGVESGFATRIADLESQAGTGSVAQQISAAIGALDANESQTASADGLALAVVETDGVITSISGSIAANTYDAYGAASDVETALIGDAQSDTASSATIAGAKKYADSLAINYDVAGAAQTAQTNAATYTDTAISNALTWEIVE